MAPKKTTGAATGGAEIAPRARGHRSLVTKRDLQAYRRRLEAELAELLDVLPYATLCLADARQRVRLR
jgi:predicted NodU family carbamoyl transferase